MSFTLFTVSALRNSSHEFPFRIFDRHSLSRLNTSWRINSLIYGIYLPPRQGRVHQQRLDRLANTLVSTPVR
jgi:hypothetical protein